MKRLQLLLLPVLLVLNFAFLAPAVSAQASQVDVCEGIGLTHTGAGCNEPSTGSVNSLVKTSVNILSYAVGVASIIMIIVGGFKYITSNGDASSVTSAKNTIMYALIGLVVAVLAQVLVRYVLTKATNPLP